MAWGPGDEGSELPHSVTLGKALPLLASVSSTETLSKIYEASLSAEEIWAVGDSRQQEQDPLKYKLQLTLICKSHSSKMQFTVFPRK